MWLLPGTAGILKQLQVPGQVHGHVPGLQASTRSDLGCSVFWRMAVGQRGGSVGLSEMPPQGLGLEDRAAGPQRQAGAVQPVVVP